MPPWRGGRPAEHSRNGGGIFDACEIGHTWLTDARNRRSRAADFTIRDSARFSIVATEWPDVKERLRIRLDRA